MLPVERFHWFEILPNHCPALACRLLISVLHLASASNLSFKFTPHPQLCAFCNERSTSSHDCNRSMASSSQIVCEKRVGSLVVGASTNGCQSNGTRADSDTDRRPGKKTTGESDWRIANAIPAVADRERAVPMPRPVFRPSIEHASSSGRIVLRRKDLCSSIWISRSSNGTTRSNVCR